MQKTSLQRKTKDMLQHNILELLLSLIAQAKRIMQIGDFTRDV
ncbi:hypothetical protein [Marinifaba aquimaris]|nr:hypothetical protein [Marinifaba aquimaris]